jgi:uncharacterized cofD-like protein
VRRGGLHAPALATASVANCVNKYDLPPAACCLLPAACCLLPAACCLPPAACRLLPAACRLLSAACCLLPAACRLLPAACRLLPAACCLPTTNNSLQKRAELSIIRSMASLFKGWSRKSRQRRAQDGRPGRQAQNGRVGVDTRARVEAVLRSGFFLRNWILVLILGIGLAGFGLTLILRDLRVLQHLPVLLRSLLQLNWIWGSLLLLGGFLLLAFGVWRLNRAFVSLLLEQDEGLDTLELVDTIIARHQHRKLRTGPKVVVIGGGTGMPTLLRGLRHYTENITAVVTVADDGGSSGRLRQQMGVLPPGDFRNNIAALSDAEGLMTQLLQYRFGDKDGLSNHNFGNLFIATMAAITGSFERGIAESSRVLAVRGRILPSTLDNVILGAEIAYPVAETVANGTDGESVAVQEQWAYVRGESNIPKAGGRIMRVHLEPDNCRAYPETVQAILAADLIIAAPGSFFTSLMPNLLVPNICKAICASTAVKLYVCNVATQAGETSSFTVTDHMNYLRQHADEAFTTVLANDAYDPAHPPSAGAQWVTLPRPDEEIDYQIFTADLVDSAHPWRHDPEKVAKQLLEIYEALRSQRPLT